MLVSDTRCNEKKDWTKRTKKTNTKILPLQAKKNDDDLTWWDTGRPLEEGSADKFSTAFNNVEWEKSYSSPGSSKATISATHSFFHMTVAHFCHCST